MGEGETHQVLQTAHAYRGRGEGKVAVYIRLALDLKVYRVYMEKVTFSGSRLQTVST